LALAAADPAHWVVVDGTIDRTALSARILDLVHERVGEPAGRGA